MCARDILRQYLFEATGLAVVGGAVGILIGMAAALLHRPVGRWPLLMELQSVVLAAAFSDLVGVFFGRYPAMRASHLDPIEALRHS